MEEMRYADDQYNLTNLICSVWLTLEPVWENISGRPEEPHSPSLNYVVCNFTHTTLPGFPGCFHMERHRVEGLALSGTQSFLPSHAQAYDDLRDITFGKGEWNAESLV